jgi:hypothetical protein
MITDQVVFTPDINNEDKIWNLLNRPTCKLSGAAYVENGWEEKVGATARGLAIIGDRLIAMAPKVNHWLFIGQGAWKPNNRVSRFKRLWKSLSEKGVELPAGERMDEFLIESDDGIKYFSAIKCASVMPKQISSVLRSGWETQLIAMEDSNSEFAVDFLLSRGWQQKGNTPAAEVLSLICNKDIFAYWPLGWFDDRQGGCGLIAQPTTLSACFPEFRPQN